MANQQERIARVIALQVGYMTDYITPDKGLVADLACDSLDLIEIVMGLEEEFDMEIQDDDAEKCKTVGDVFDLIARLVPASA